MITGEQVPREHRHMFSFTSVRQNQMEAVIKAGAGKCSNNLLSLALSTSALKWLSIILSALSASSEKKGFGYHLSWQRPKTTKNCCSYVTNQHPHKGSCNPRPQNNQKWAQFCSFHLHCWWFHFFSFIVWGGLEVASSPAGGAFDKPTVCCLHHLNADIISENL